MIISSKQLTSAILAALADAEMILILNLCMYNPKSVNEIIVECRIPHTTAYRKVKWLVDENLMFVERIIIKPEGKKYSMFLSVYKSFNIKYDHKEILIDAELIIDRKEKIAKHFYSVN